MIVFDRNFVGMSNLPPKRHPILVIDPDAVATGVTPFQELETIAGWHHEVVQPSRCVDQLQLALGTAPDISSNGSGGFGVALAKEVSSSLVAK